MVTTAMKSKDSCSVKKSYDKLDSILKSRDITLPTKVHLVKAMIFPVVELLEGENVGFVNLHLQHSFFKIACLSDKVGKNVKKMRKGVTHLGQ